MLNRLQANSNEEKRVFRHCFFLVGGLVILDHFTKLLVVEKIDLHEKITIIPGFFNLVYVLNRGAAWGILANQGWLLLSISVTVLILIIIFIRKLTEGCLERYYALALVASGIIGNSIDRIWRSSVVDFLDFYINGWHWPAFNVADSAITVGFTIFIISNIFRPQENNPDKIQKKNGVPIFK